MRHVSLHIAVQVSMRNLKSSLKAVLSAIRGVNYKKGDDRLRTITLEAARKNAGYTQKEVAKVIGVHNQTVSKYEKDSSRIPFDLMERLCTLYGVSKDDIFFGKKYEKNSTKLEKPDEKVS